MTSSKNDDNDTIQVTVKIKPKSSRSRRCVIVVEDPDDVVENVEFEQETRDDR